MKNKIFNLLIVDDHPVVVAGIKALLENLDGFKVAATAANAFEAMDFLRSNPIDIAFLDINLPDINGFDLCKKIKKEYPGIKVIGLSTYSDRSYILGMLDSGASGYLIKNATQQEIAAALKTVIENEIYLSVTLENLIKSSSSLHQEVMPSLTKREKQVLQLIADGCTTQNIASQLFISTLTVDSHRKSLLAKFNVNNTAALIKLAFTYHLLDN